MDSFIDACISRYRSVILILIMILLLGLSSYRSIPKERSPDVQIPFIYVSMTHEGISPEDAERLLVRPMETELRSIEGVKEMTAIASEGVASVTLEFHAGFNSEKALLDVREKVDLAKSELPEETDEPTVNEINLSLFPVINVILMGNIPEHSMVKISKNLRDKIEEVSNVLNVEIGGNREDVVELVIDPKIIEHYGLSLDVLNSVSTGFNRLIAAGAMDSRDGRYSVKVPGLLENVDDIMSLPVQISGDAIITVRDIATIKKTFRDPQNFARVNGQPAMVLEVSKRNGTNIIDTIEQVKQVIEHERQYLPEQIQISYSQDNSSNIKEMLKDLENNIILAVFLVMIIIIYFIGMRSAALITIAIPGAFLMGILILDFMQLTLNIVVLFSLILSIGMLVDSAIVVCEMADRQMMEGTSSRKAYVNAAKYMKWPIIASTATTLVVFTPLLFWPGIVGQFMQYMPITLIATLSSSLIMAIIFVPTIGTIISNKQKPDQKLLEAAQITESGDLDKLNGFYRVYYKSLKWVLSNSGKFAGSVFALLCVVYIAYGAFGTGFEFFPEIEPDNSQIIVRARGNISVYEKDTIVKQVESRIYSLKDEVRVFYTRAGNIGENNKQSLPEDTIGIIQMEYSDWKLRRSASEITNDILKLTSDIPGIIVQTQDEQSGPTQAKPIEIQVSSRYPELLKPAIEKLLDNITKLEGITNIEDSRPVPLIEWVTELDRQMAARFDNNVTTLGNFIKLVTNGLKITSYRPDDSDDEVDILARVPEEKRNLSTLESLKVVTNAGAVPASNFIEITAMPKTSVINRTNGMRVISIKADVAKGYLADSKVREVKKWLAENNFDERINVKFKGDDESQQETSSFLGSAFLLALFCMALILVTQFNSIYYMLIILSAVFLSTVGVLLGLLITAQPFGIVMCGVGIISVAGIVVNNNIIFIDTYQKLKLSGMETHQALLRTGIQRIRPILLTAGTTVLGLFPMVMAMNIDFASRAVTFGAPSSQWWTQLSTTIAGGLSFATILTLFFTPALIMLGDKMFRKVK